MGGTWLPIMTGCCIVAADVIAGRPCFLAIEPREPGDILRVSRRDVVVLPMAGQGGPVLKSATIEMARTMMPGWDIYALEADWRAVWQQSGRPSLRSPDAAFIGWLKKRG